MMQMGVDGIFVGSGIFKSEDPKTMADAIVLQQLTTMTQTRSLKRWDDGRSTNAWR